MQKKLTIYMKMGSKTFRPVEGISSYNRFFFKIQIFFPHAKKIFVCAFSSNLTICPKCPSYRRPAEKDLGSIPGLGVELLNPKVGANSVGHTVCYGNLDCFLIFNNGALSSK